ncbi:ribosomal protein S18 acetylase RimI-like enzyme [Elusimicrobium simillimum]|uniref:GNAT family N-acetyltransferase n=1 Tax=Elusimicrobium simillimum TaxID=3143438 RepID=UPI003C6EE4D6
MSVEIIPVNKKNFNRFINFPYKLYKNDKFWVGDLKMDAKHLFAKDPFWNHATKKLFLAYRDKKVVGRICAFINHTHNEYWREHTGMFGFFDTIDDKKVSDALLNAAKTWLKEKGMDKIRGPFNPSTNHTCGMLVAGFDEHPFIMMPYNYAYYNELMESAGFTKAKDLIAFERTGEDQFSPRFAKIVDRAAAKGGVKIRPIDIKNFNAEVMIVRDIYNKSWAQNWGFLPISEAEIMETARQLKPIVNTEITAIAEVDGVPAGFYISIPNMNQVLKVLKGSILNPLRLVRALLAWRKIKHCRLIMLGVLPEYRRRGLDLILIKHIVEHGQEVGYNMAELSWMLEDNKDITTVVKESGCRLSNRRYRVYESKL